MCGAEELGVRVMTGGCSDRVAREAIEHISIQQAIREGKYVDDFLQDTDEPEKDGEPHSSYEIISHTYKNVDTVAMDELRENYKELVWFHVQRDILTASIIQNTERQVDPFTMEQIKLEAVNETDRLLKDRLDKLDDMKEFYYPD